jgi:Secretion system C-terminal sorting domain
VQDCDLISPVFDFTKAKGVLIQFEHFFRYYFGSTATLSYSTDGGSSWTLLQSWEESTDNATLFLQDLTTQLAGFSKVCFKWNYVGNYAYYWALDDIKISADISSIPETLAFSDTIFSTGADNCSGAMQVITVAGIGSTVEFKSGSTVNLIAGKSIQFLPGFHAFEGSYAHAFITLDSSFCADLAGSIVQNLETEKSVEISAALKGEQVFEDEKSVKIYPNPNNGNFTLEFSNLNSRAEIRIFNAIGATIYRSMIKEQDQQKINLSGIKKGLYFVKVMDGKEQMVKKMIVN